MAARGGNHYGGGRTVGAMQQSERVSSTSGDTGPDNNDEESDIELESWPGDSASPHDSE